MWGQKFSFGVHKIYAIVSNQCDADQFGTQIVSPFDIKKEARHMIAPTARCMLLRVKCAGASTGLDLTLEGVLLRRG